jgi:hypothetical protein
MTVKGKCPRRRLRSTSEQEVRKNVTQNEERPSEENDKELGEG